MNALPTLTPAANLAYRGPLPQQKPAHQNLAIPAHWGGKINLNFQDRKVFLNGKVLVPLWSLRYRETKGKGRFRGQVRDARRVRNTSRSCFSKSTTKILGLVSIVS